MGMAREVLSSARVMLSRRKDYSTAVVLEDSPASRVKVIIQRGIIAWTIIFTRFARLSGDFVR